MIDQVARKAFFLDLWQRAFDIAVILPGDVGLLRLVIETHTGHRVVVLPLETCDGHFMEAVVQGVMNIAAAKGAAAHTELQKNRTV